MGMACAGGVQQASLTFFALHMALFVVVPR